VPQVTYYNVASVTLTTGTGQNFIGVESTLAGTTTIVNGNGIGDEMTIENTANSLDDIQGPVQLQDKNPYNVAFVDSGNSATHSYTLSTGQLVRDGIAPIRWDVSQPVAVSLAASTSGGTINVPSYGGNSFAVIVANTGDTVTVGSAAAQGLTEITANLRIQSVLGQGPNVTLDDSGNPNPRTWDLGSDAAFGFSPGTFGYVIDPHTDPNYGYIGLALDPASAVSILGGPADDDFRIHDFTGAPAISLAAEPTTSTRTNPHNKLDYSGYTGTVQVIMPLNIATGFASVSGIQDVTGGNGNNLIVGDAQPHVFIGGTGRNVIIGGAAGGCTITGGAGDNLLIGGYTSYDSNQTALDAIFAEWTSSDSLSTRKGNISGKRISGLDLNENYVLVAVGTKTRAQTVFAPVVVDNLFDGTGLSWFLVARANQIDNGAGPDSALADEVTIIR
jgi:hypothetical protein